MKCHYEILEVARDAELGDIKSAYRRAALKWHPDKNLDNVDEAKRQFQLVQQAYEVLSDPHERTWYDKHREQILHGAKSEFQDNTLDVFQFFTSSCFKGYGDDEQGFYTIYRNVFDAIIKEDMDFMEDKEEMEVIPRFGDSKSEYEQVVGPFYSFWSSYCTKKSYVWLDPYNINEVRDRRVYKLVEKDNKKVRLKAKKERNDEVRNLVAFVRKRDKRVQEHAKMLAMRVKENRQKHEELSRQKRMQRRKELHADTPQAEWAKFHNFESELEQMEKSLAEQFGEDFSNSEDEESKAMNDNLYCVACNKIFKTTKAFENHESSKKHRDNVERLKEELIDEDEQDESLSANEDDLTENGINDLEDLKLSNDDGVSEDIMDELEEAEAVKKRKKKGKKVISHTPEENGEFEITLGAKSPNAQNTEDFNISKKKPNKKPRNRKPKGELDSTSNATEPSNSFDIKHHKLDRKTKKTKADINVDEIDVSHCCVTCKSTFTSKNKLFDHLKKTNHGVQLTVKSNKCKKNVVKET